MFALTYNSNTKMALRAVVVAIVCIIVTHTFTLERSYWVFLTAFLLITQSFGDGIYRSSMRFILTVVGCLIGWMIYLPFENHLNTLIVICLISLFLMLYWFTSSLVGRTLVTGILLVASFGIINGGWTFDMLIARILDTFIGAAIAVVVNGLILPEFSNANVYKTFEDMRQRLLQLNLTLCQST